MDRNIKVSPRIGGHSQVELHLYNDKGKDTENGREAHFMSGHLFPPKRKKDTEQKPLHHHYLVATCTTISFAVRTLKHVKVRIGIIAIDV